MSIQNIREEKKINGELKVFFNDLLMLYIKDVKDLKYLYSNNINANVWEIELQFSTHKQTIKLGTRERFLRIINILEACTNLP